MATSERKRPWYLVLSLLAALAFGANGAKNGWETVMLYREPIDPSLAGEGIRDEADRAAVVARLQAYVNALDAAKSRGWPLAVATLLLGVSTLFFAMRAMGGSGGARTVLVQLVIAQAGMNAAQYWLMRDAEDAYMHFQFKKAAVASQGRDHMPDEMSRAMNTVALAFHAIGSALVVVGLTRRRSRDFFESTTAVVGER
jgi:hypothetical protein